MAARSSTVPCAFFPHLAAMNRYRPLEVGPQIPAMLKSDPSTWTDARHRRGAEAERLAAGVMAAAGFEIIEQRFRSARHDVDLVARRGSTVVFAEVKSRSDASFGRAHESVTARKQVVLTRTAAVWLQRYGRPGDVARFDVLTVEGGAVDWIQDAFRPLWR